MAGVGIPGQGLQDLPYEPRLDYNRGGDFYEYELLQQLADARNKRDNLRILYRTAKRKHDRHVYEHGDHFFHMERHEFPNELWWDQRDLLYDTMMEYGDRLDEKNEDIHVIKKALHEYNARMRHPHHVKRKQGALKDAPEAPKKKPNKNFPRIVL